MIIYAAAVFFAQLLDSMRLQKRAQWVRGATKTSGSACVSTQQIPGRVDYPYPNRDFPVDMFEDIGCTHQPTGAGD